MALLEETLFGSHDKVAIALQRLRTFEPPEGYYLAFSGGKDSQCVYHLCKEAGVKFDAHYSHTTVDPPEVIYFMRENYPDVIVDRHDTTMWQLIVKKGMPPTRMVRYCCDELKEGGGCGRIMVTGVRWAESSKRKNNRGLLELNNYTKKYVKLMNDNDEARRMFETCTMKSMHTLNPIIDWTQEEVWEYLHSRNIPYCKLYDEASTASAVSAVLWLARIRCATSSHGTRSTSRHTSGHLKRCLPSARIMASPTINGKPQRM